MKPGRFSIFFVFLFAVGHASAEVYTWTDDKGTVHFTDQRPPGSAAMTINPAPASVMPMSENLRAGEAITTTVQSSTPTEERTRRRRAKRDREQQQVRCEKYRHQLANIQSQLRAGYSNTKGNSLRARRRQLSARLSRECILG